MESILLTALEGELLCLHHALVNGCATHQSNATESSSLKQCFFQGCSFGVAERTSNLTVMYLNIV